MRSPSNRCRDDLLARSRRVPLSAVEQRALDAHLGVCGLCQAERAFATLYDAVPDRPLAEDDALVARLAERIAGRGAAARPRHRVELFVSAAVIALVVGAGAAAAWVSTHRLPSPAPESPGAPRMARARPSVAARAARPTPLDERPLPEAPAAEAAPDLRPPAIHKIVARRRNSAAAQPEQTPVDPKQPTAAELFAAANAARRGLDLRGAIDRYLAVERLFPDSEEALVSRVSAGDLLSRLGEPDAALRAFDRYLARRPEGALAPEALFGRARSLQSLGSRQDEADAWRRLLRAFPGSIYEAAGRRRLDEILR